MSRPTLGLATDTKDSVLPPLIMYLLIKKTYSISPLLEQNGMPK